MAEGKGRGGYPQNGEPNKKEHGQISWNLLHIRLRGDYAGTLRLIMENRTENNMENQVEITIQGLHRVSQKGGGGLIDPRDIEGLNRALNPKP